MNTLASLPVVRVTASGAPLSAGELQALSHVRVQQRLALPTLCELVFCDPPASLLNASWLVPGSALTVALVGQPESLFVGQITALEYVYTPQHSLEMHIRGYDLLHQLRKRQTVRAHVQVSARDLAQELVADLGLSVEAPTPGPLWSRLIQHRQSDLELLQEICERCGLYPTLRGSVLHLVTLQGSGEAVPLILGQSLLEAHIEWNADVPYSAVDVTGWDSARVEKRTAQAEQARPVRKSGFALAASDVGGNGRRDLLDEGALDDEHAEGIAQAELDAYGAQEFTLWGVAEGDIRLRPGIPVEVTGVAERLAGSYVLTAVTHRIDVEKGFISELSSTPPRRRSRPRSTVAVPGVVTRIDDPENLGRVCVALTSYKDVETDWMGVLSAGAGKGKGLMALPDIGDQVLVLLAHEDPGQGIVLGGLYGREEPPDVGIEGGAVKRYTLLTPGGQRIQLDDGQGLIRVENNKGSYMELSPEKVKVHAMTDLEIEAPGQRITIRGQQIDFERG